MAKRGRLGTGVSIAQRCANSFAAEQSLAREQYRGEGAAPARASSSGDLRHLLTEPFAAALRAFRRHAGADCWSEASGTHASQAQAIAVESERSRSRVPGRGGTLIPKGRAKTGWQGKMSFSKAGYEIGTGASSFYPEPFFGPVEFIWPSGLQRRGVARPGRFFRIVLWSFRNRILWPFPARHERRCVAAFAGAGNVSVMNEIQHVVVASDPCQHGHTVGRYRNGRCIACARDIARAYRERHPEIEAARFQRWLDKHGGHRPASSRKKPKKRAKQYRPRIVWPGVVSTEARL